MTKELKSIYKVFPDNSDCIHYLEEMRWNGEPLCPRCGYSKFSPVKGLIAYRCTMCNRTFTVTTKTFLHKTKLDLQKWFYAVHVMLNPHQKVSARWLGDNINVTKDTAWSIQNKIKKALITEPKLLMEIDKKVNTIYNEK